MNPAARLSIALLVGLVLWLPTLGATMRGDVDLPESAIRYLVAFLLARVAVAGLARLVQGYVAVDDEDGEPMDDSMGAQVDDPPRRRREDAVPTAPGMA